MNSIEFSCQQRFWANRLLVVEIRFEIDYWWLKSGSKLIIN